MEEKNFLFSLYADDLIEVARKKVMPFSIVNSGSTLPHSYETTHEMVYYGGLDISSGNIKVITHDNSYSLRGLGIKTLNTLQKYEVDILGNVREVKKKNVNLFDKVVIIWPTGM